MNTEQCEQVEGRLADLAAVGTRLDPVPSDAFEAAIASFSWRNLDAELADLVFDSAAASAELVGVRSTRVSRQLTFEAPHLAVELEVDDQADCALVGQLVPPDSAEVEICSPGASLSLHADQRGRFWARAFPGPVVSLRIRPRASEFWVTTPWIALFSPSR